MKQAALFINFKGVTMTGNVPEQEYKSFSGQLKNARKAAKLNQTQLAEKLAELEPLATSKAARVITIKRAMSLWETEKQIPNGYMLIKLQDILNTVFSFSDERK